MGMGRDVRVRVSLSGGLLCHSSTDRRSVFLSGEPFDSVDRGTRT